MAFPRLDPTSFLFITLDSCRYDTFAAAGAPYLKSVGALHRAVAPGNFTYSAHSAMFMGFTPGIASIREPFVNPKFGKIFKMAGTGHAGSGRHFAHLEGRNVIDGLKRLDYVAVGAGAVNWFNPKTPAAQALIQDFDHFYHPGDTYSLGKQLDFAYRMLRRYEGRRVLLFVNVGETHVPYYHQGAHWEPYPNPCIPFGEQNDAEECRRRQRECLEYVDRELAPLLEAFRDANVLVCADHGDAWGEDGLWEHGIHHPMVLEVPLLFRLTHSPQSADPHPEGIATLVEAIASRLGRLSRGAWR